MNSHKFPSPKFLIAAALAAAPIVAFRSELFDLGSPLLKTVLGSPGFTLLLAGIAVLFAACVLEWRAIGRMVHLSTFPPSVPYARRERRMVLSLGVALSLLFVQFIGVVYAMTFTLSSSTSESKKTKQIITGDFDGDGDLDYIAFNLNAVEEGHNLYKNDGNGTFTAQTAFGISASFTDADAGDLDGDGDLDLVAINSGSSNMWKYINDGTGAFTASSTTVSTPTSMTLADFDSDGDLDFVVSAASVMQGLYLNNGVGTFTAAASSIPALTQLVAADFNSDGAIDLAGLRASDNTAVVYVNSGTGAFVSRSSAVVGSSPDTLSAADLDNDGDIDLIASAAVFDYVVTNDGTGVITSAGSFGNGGTLSTPLADMDNDGDNDIVVARTAGNIEVWINNGSASFSNSNSTPTDSDTTQGIGIADIDADGDLDYIAGNGQASAEVNRHYVNDQAATSANTAPTAPTASSMSATDVTSRTSRSPGTGADDSSVGTVSWSGPVAVTASDNIAAIATLLAGETSHYLKATNFDFEIPSNATIYGIKVEWEKAGGPNVTDARSRLVKGGTIQSTDKSSASGWPSGADAYVSYGDSTDLWGTTWTPSDINTSTFGAALAATAGSLSSPNSATVDHARITVYYGLDVKLAWGSGSDSQTATRMLQYQVRVGTGASNHTIAPGRTNGPVYVSRLMPNGQSRQFILKNVKCGYTYYWGVSTVDSGFRSTASSEKTFTISSACVLSEGGGSSGGSGGSTEGGGGGGWFKPDTGKSTSKEGDPGEVKVAVFRDLNGDGRKQDTEQRAFERLPITAKGKTSLGRAIDEKAAIGEDGTVTLSLPPSDKNGYTIEVSTDHESVQDHVATTKTVFPKVLVTSKSSQTFEVGFHREDLIRYHPCLRVGSPLKNESLKESEPLVLLQRLEDAFKFRVPSGVDLTAPLMSRRNFLILLLKTECIERITDEAALTEKLRNAFEISRKTPGSTWKTILLKDLPLSPLTPDASLVYSLLATGVPVHRPTLIGVVADLSAPVTRQESMILAEAAMQIPDARREKRETILPSDLPKDLPKESFLSPSYATLQSLGVLPESYTRVLGPTQGVTTEEAAIFMIRASFRAGRIRLIPDTVSVSKKKGTPTFLSVLQTLNVLIPPCLEQKRDRARTVTFRDLLPGDKPFFDLREILMRGTRNTDKKVLWMLPGTLRITEFGVERGQSLLSAPEAVSILETLRAALILQCLPPETPAEVLAFKKNPVWVGTGQSRVQRDRISDLPRDTSFASRVLYRAQDRTREYDLSIFTYAYWLLSAPVRRPTDGLTIREGADLLASTLTGLLVRTRVIPPGQAEEKANSLAEAILRAFMDRPIDAKELLPTTVTTCKQVPITTGKKRRRKTIYVLQCTTKKVPVSREDDARTKVPLTRAMLTDFLATVLLNRKAVSEVPAEILPLGELWWDRIGATGGEKEPARFIISGHVYRDLNTKKCCSGVKDANEEGIAGRTVALRTADGLILLGEAVTGEKGAFVLRDVEAGEYRLSHPVPSGYKPTTSDSVTLTVKADAEYNFGVFKEEYTVSGYVYQDLNTRKCCSGVKDPDEKGISQRTVTLRHPNGSKTQAVTDAAGGFVFSKLTPGNYTLSHPVPSGYVRTTSDSVTLTVKADAEYNFGVFKEEYTVSGYVYQDLNTRKCCRGRKDANEKGMPERTVTLRNSKGSKTNAVTDASGKFVFPNVVPGKYQLSHPVPKGFAKTTQDSLTITVKGDMTYDFGLYRK